MTLPSTARETDASSTSAQDDTKTEETVEDPTETVWKKPEPIEEEWPPIACSSGSAKTASSEAFCDCFKNNKEPKDCRCGEEDSAFEWDWDEETKSTDCVVKPDGREVLFHVDFSCGTAAVRGSLPMTHDQYYWEVKMTTPVYGTDMMIGVGTKALDLDRYRSTFCSLLGRDAESWGLSYTGCLQHQGIKQNYSSRFGQGTIIGVHLDMWHGCLSFYRNHRPIGIAHHGLHGKVLYPMLSSTAARSGMKMIRSRSFQTSLQFMCCQFLRKYIPQHLDVFTVMNFPPGLKAMLENNISWLMKPYPRVETKRQPGGKRPHSEVECEETTATKRQRTLTTLAANACNTPSTSYQVVNKATEDKSSS